MSSAGEDDFLRAVEAYFSAWKRKESSAVVNRHAGEIVRVVDSWEAEGTALHRLHSLLGNADPAVQLAAANSLVRLAAPEKAIPVLRTLQSNGPGRIALDARLALMLLEKRK